MTPSRYVAASRHRPCLAPDALAGKSAAAVTAVLQEAIAAVRPEAKAAPRDPRPDGDAFAQLAADLIARLAPLLVWQAGQRGRPLTLAWVLADEAVPLAKDHGLWPVEVFRLARVEAAATEGIGPPPPVADRRLAQYNEK